jgi:DNA-binding NarL/FixJ family response regulator
MGKRLPLAPREKQILMMMNEGRTISQISRELNITALTITRHVAHARERLEMPSSVNHATVVAEAVRRNLLR